METKQLRVGNWVNERIGSKCGIELSPHKVTARDIGATQVDGEIDYLEPLPLTPELIEKCGFNKQADYLGWYEMEYKNSLFEFSFGDTIESFELDFKQSPTDEWIGFKIPYLHQLQNLFYALTGEELEFRRISRLDFLARI